MAKMNPVGVPSGKLPFHMMTDQITLGGLQKRNRIFKRFIKNQLAAHREEAGVKTALVSPFETKWPRINRDIQQTVTEKLRAALEPLQGRVNRGGRKKREREKEEEAALVTGDDFTDTLRLEHKSSIDKKREEIRQSMVFGINDATRRLERDELSCLVVCSSTASICPTNHLQILAATRNCPAMCVRDFSINVGRSVGMNSMLVLAIKKSPPAPEAAWIQDLVKLISDNAQPLRLPWVQLDDPYADEETPGDDAKAGIKTEPTTSTSNSKPTTSTSNSNTKPTPSTSDTKPTTTKPRASAQSEPKKAFDINTLYIKKSDSDWLKDDTKIVPIIRGSKSLPATNFIKLDSPKPKPVLKNPFSAPELDEPKKKKMKRVISAGYLPPHVQRVPRDENRKKRQAKRKKKGGPTEGKKEG